MLILGLLIFAIPATFAAILHMVVIRLGWFETLSYPLDFRRTWKGRRIFGDSKTFRGLAAMVVFSIAGSYLLYFLVNTYPAWAALNVLEFDRYSPAFYGVLYGLGYVVAELPNSFYKRRRGIPEGKRGTLLNILIDQADSPAGCLVFILPFSGMDARFFWIGILFYLFLHMFFNFVLYLSGLRKNPL
jgi:hypothetical protein